MCDRFIILGEIAARRFEVARELYDFEIEPEVREWLDSLSDGDFKRVDEVVDLLAEIGCRTRRAVVGSSGRPCVGAADTAS
ncbi:hypothetical protein [Planomonospora sp. ID91781]|uniref:hypothetical protein n=1 Tax=Planomonospora sp. ID91781 TaxID=2738135 RepID=UPI001E57C661|nr:hypothetical protein [Planomonospora sp. ID91781]